METRRVLAGAVIACAILIVICAVGVADTTYWKGGDTNYPTEWCQPNWKNSSGNQNTTNPDCYNCNGTTNQPCESPSYESARIDNRHSPGEYYPVFSEFACGECIDKLSFADGTSGDPVTLEIVEDRCLQACDEIVVRNRGDEGSTYVQKLGPGTLRARVQLEIRSTSAESGDIVLEVVGGVLDTDVTCCPETHSE